MYVLAEVVPVTVRRSQAQGSGVCSLSLAERERKIPCEWYLALFRGVVVSDGSDTDGRESGNVEEWSSPYAKSPSVLIRDALFSALCGRTYFL